MSFSLCGTRLRIGLPFVVLLAAYAFLGLGIEAAIAFLSVAAHEAAHALVASAYDLRVDSVELTPFGGVARLSGYMEQDPYVEISVALAGPASSFLLAGIATVLWRVGMLQGEAPSMLIDINLLLGAANLIPALPLDGGRVARASLSKRVGYRRATGLVGSIGKALAAGAVMLGTMLALAGRLFPNLIVYGLFGYMFASSEQKRVAYDSFSLMIRRKQSLAKQGVVRTQDLTAISSISLEQVVRAFSARHYSTVTILGADMRPVGTLNETEIVEHILSGRGRETLAEILNTPYKP